MPDLSRKHSRDSIDSNKSNSEQKQKKKAKDFATGQGLSSSDAPTRSRITPAELQEHADALLKELPESAQQARNIIRMISSLNEIMKQRGIDRWQQLSQEDATRQRIEQVYYEIITQQKSTMQTLEAIIGSSSDQQAASTSEVPIQYRTEHGEPSTDQQSTQDDPTMKRFLDKKALSEIVTREYVKSLDTSSSRAQGKKHTSLTHLARNIRELRAFSQYNNYSYEEAVEAYKAIKTAYSDGTYEKFAMARCKNLGFPFAQD